jgi:hypothetical protein
VVVAAAAAAAHRYRARHDGVIWCGVMWCGMVWCGLVWWTPSPHGAGHAAPRPGGSDGWWRRPQQRRLAARGSYCIRYLRTTYVTAVRKNEFLVFGN